MEPQPAPVGSPVPSRFLTEKSQIYWIRVRVWWKSEFLVRGWGRGWGILTPAPHPPRPAPAF